jgi:cell division septation protein DedD
MQSKNPAVLVPGYYINVGLFAVPANGTKAYKKLEAAGLPVFSDPVKKNDITVTRVRVGPYPTQAKAAAAAKKIRALKLDAAIFKHKG